MERLIFSFNELSSSHHRTMDILSKDQTDKVPKLESLCLDNLAKHIIGVLFDQQLHYSSRTALLNGRNGPYIPSHVEETLKMWSKYIPVRLKENMLSSSIQVLKSLLGSGGLVIDSRTRINPLPMLVASLFQSLFDCTFTKISVPSELQWVKESRLKVLHLLHSSNNPFLTEARFDCYPKNKLLHSIQFSEEYLLANCFNKLPKLKILTLPFVCTNEILSQLCNCCPMLEVLSIEGSFGVTDEGIALYCTKSAPCLPPANKRGKVDLKDPATRIGFQATPIIAGCTDQLKMFQMIKAKKSSKITEEEITSSAQIPKPLKQLDLTGTSVTIKGAEQVLKELKELRILKLNEDIWGDLFNGLKSEELCFDCIETCDKMATINFTENVALHLAPIYDLFPNLSHLTINLSRLRNMNEDDSESIGNMQNFLPGFKALKSLTIIAKNNYFNLLGACITPDVGHKIQTVCLKGSKSSVVDMSKLNLLFPNVQSLTVSHTSLVCDLNSSKFSTKLRAVKLWQIENSKWKVLVRNSPLLEKVFLWNLVITDQDFLHVIPTHLKRVQDLRIGGDEIGYVRLSEDSVKTLLQSCPEIRTIGGVVEWKGIKDLTGLLREMFESDWRLRLDQTMTKL